MRVRILNSNTHVGQGLFSGKLHQCAEELDVDILTVQEVSRFRARQALRKQFPSVEWGIHGLQPAVLPGFVGPGNLVLWRKEMFHKVGGNRDFLSPQLWVGGKRDKWHPVRRLCQVRLVADGNKSKRLAVGSDHPWTTRGHDGFPPDRVKRGHRKQVREQAELAWDAMAHRFDVAHLGDENERMGLNIQNYAKIQYRAHGMRHVLPDNATRFSIDGAFISTRLRAVSFDWIPKHLLGSDHDGILLVVEI